MLPPHSCRKFEQWVKLIYKYTLSCTACEQQQQQQQQTNRTLISVPDPVHFWLFSKYIITSVVAPTAFMSALGSSQDQLLLFFFLTGLSHCLSPHLCPFFLATFSIPHIHVVIIFTQSLSLFVLVLLFFTQAIISPRTPAPIHPDSSLFKHLPWNNDEIFSCADVSEHLWLNIQPCLKRWRIF